MRSRLIALGLILAIAAFAYFSGLFQYLSPDRLGELANSAGALGPIVVMVLFAVLEPFGAPGPIFMLAAVTLWPFWLALTVNWLGATGAGMVGFAFARYLARDWVAARLPARAREWDDRLSSRGLPLVIGFRLMFFLNPASHWALGLSRVSVLTATLGTAIGFAPGVLLWTYFGAEILAWFETQSVGVWLACAIAIIGFFVFRSYRARARKPVAELGEP